jgi:transposase
LVASVTPPEDAIVSDSSARSRHNLAVTGRWVERLARFRSGRHTVAAFCAAEGVSQANFYLWRRRLARPAPAPAALAPAVVPLRLTPSPAAPIEMALPSGAIVRFPAGTGPEVIVAVLRGLGDRPC